MSVNVVEVSNGVRLPYVERGSQSGVPVVMLHGYTDSWRSFEPVLPRLPQWVHALALTQRGHGDADRPATGYGAHDFASDVAAFMDALDLGRAVIVGHSMGGYIAQRFAMEYPERLLGLMLVGSFATWRHPVLAELRAQVAQLVDPVDPAFARAFQESTVAQTVAPAFMETVVRESLKLPAGVWQAVLEALEDADSPPEPGAITAPTRILWGDRDALLARGEQEALAGAIAGARLVVYHGAGHALHWEEPERFARDLADFARQLTGGAEDHGITTAAISSVALRRAIA
jgi:non-heme chloroperoxidase